MTCSRDELYLDYLSVLVMLACALEVVFSLPRSCCHMVDSITTSALSAVSLNTHTHTHTHTHTPSLFHPVVWFVFCLIPVS
jgi:hypothetical protein